MITLLRKYKQNKEMSGHSNDSNVFSFLPAGKSSCTTSTGRSALLYLFQSKFWNNDDSILIPAYVPEGIIKPIIASGIKISFYKLDHHLFPNLDDLRSQVKQDPSICACIIIHPLGFEAPIDEIKQILNAHDILCIEDCAHGMFSHYQSGEPFGQKGDCALFSLNKFLPVPDGAVLMSHLDSVNLDVSKASQCSEHSVAINHYMEHLAINSAISDSEDITLGSQLLDDSAAAYNRYYEIMNNDFSLRQMSRTTEVIQMSIDYEALMANRRKNCQFLYQKLDNAQINLLFTDYSDNIIPLAVPALVPEVKREKWLFDLQKKGISLATLVHRWNYIPANQEAKYSIEVQYINAHVLIPINEFLSEQHMTSLVSALNQLN